MSFKMLRSIFLTLILAMVLLGCNSASKSVTPAIETVAEIPIEEQAVVVGRFFHVYEGWFNDEEQDAGFMVHGTHPSKELETKAVNTKDVVEEKGKHSFQRMYGGLKTYYLKPGKYSILAYNILLGDTRYDMMAPAKENTLLGIFGMFDTDFWADPQQYMRDHNKTYSKIRFGEMTVRAGEVIYFGDVQVHQISGKLIFKSANKLNEARDHLTKTNPELKDKLQFKPWQGLFFIPTSSKEKPDETADDTKKKEEQKTS